MREAGEKIAMLTCYDASFAALLERAAVDVMLIGDSLGNVLQGHATTLPVSLADVAYHTACVARRAGRHWLSPTCRSAPTARPPTRMRARSNCCARVRRW